MLWPKIPLPPPITFLMVRPLVLIRVKNQQILRGSLFSVGNNYQFWYTYNNLYTL